jgi:CBS domain-containing protein
MREIDAGFPPVGEDDRMVGMITARDIAIRALPEGKGPDSRIEEVMSYKVSTASTTTASRMSCR